RCASPAARVVLWSTARSTEEAVMRDNWTLLAICGALAFATPARGDTTATSSLTAPAQATATAPAVYKVKFSTTKGNFVVEVHRDWAPQGADRFYNLVKLGYYNDVAFFRVVQGFMVQFGIHGDPAVNRAWRAARIPDDPTGKQSNTRGMVTFA